MHRALRDIVADYLWIRSIRRHRSRLGRKLAPKYTAYLKQAQRNRDRIDDPETIGLARHFQKECWATFNPATSRQLARSMCEKICREEKLGLQVWDQSGRYVLGDIYQKYPEIDQLFQAELGNFLRATYGASFKIFYGVCYKSVNNPNGAAGSQLWHADGGPGTCINLMWCLSPVSRENGAMECVPWNISLNLFSKERSAVRARLSELSDDPSVDERIARRNIICDYYNDEITRRYANFVVQPEGESGLLFAFSNNLVHKGGYPEPGRERYVCVFHIYPSLKPTPFKHYRKSGIAKVASYPADPAFQDAV